LCVSAHTEKALLARIELANTTVVPLGVEGSPVERPEDAVPRDSGLLLSVGGIKPRKGQDDVIRAIARLAPTYPNLIYAIVGRAGDPGYLTHLTVLASELGVRDRVQIVTDADDAALDEWYRRCQVFVLPSVQAGELFEGFGLVYLEAMARGRPVIGCWNTGAEEPIQDGVQGLLVPQRDPAALADALAQVLADRGLRERLGRAGLERARELSWARTADRVVAAYEVALGRPVQVPAPA
jgi:glycosyltransferase involved in cell wall biosynthesis